jgi:hypothetical protein
MPSRTATVIGMQIEPIHRLQRSQDSGQLQLCVPPVTTKGDSHRLQQALAGKGVKALT